MLNTNEITSGNNLFNKGLVSLFVGTSSSLCASSFQSQMNTFGFDEPHGLRRDLRVDHHYGRQLSTHPTATADPRPAHRTRTQHLSEGKEHHV